MNLLRAQVKVTVPPNAGEVTNSSSSYSRFPACVGLKSAGIASESFQASFDSRRRKHVLFSLDKYWCSFVTH